MSFAPGDRLGVHEVVERIGAGGMGEVFRARDARLGREVAIKVLPQAFASDPERLARFEREARLLASLNHPNIAHVYGFETATQADGSGIHFLAMELVEGEDLAERLKRGAIPPDEAIAIAKQIAEALAEAHEKGIVHRDLKPANVKVTADGRVKVLDFGLAKAYAGEAASGSSADLSQSPTLAHAGTQAGIILGTAAYMSPEQARGKAVDKRADIWAFGVVLFEMLTGRQLFAGETVSDVLAAVLVRDPDWRALPPATPPAITQLLRHCLARDPRQRLHDIADARLAIDEAIGGDGGVPMPVSGAAPRGRGAALAWVVAGVCAAVAAGLAVRGGATASPPRALTTFGIPAPEGHFLTRSQSPLLDISADGRRLVFVAQGKASAGIHRRDFDRMAVAFIEGTEAAENPVISPDGRFVAFFARGMLRRVALEGGAAAALAEALAPRGACWAPDGSLVFSPDFTSPLHRVASTGGRPVAITTLDAAKGERSHRWPQVLPDGRTVIFTVGLTSRPGDYDDSTIDAQPLDGGARRTILRGARMARYTPAGYLVYQRRETLLAVRFDPHRLEVSGEPFTVQEGLGGDASSGAGYFSVGANGIVAVVPEASIQKDRVLVLADQQGRETPLAARPASFNHPRFSPDGSKVALAIGSGSSADDDVYVLDLATQRMQRLTFGQGHGGPTWSRDGRRIVYTTGRTGEVDLEVKAADGSGAAVPLAKESGFLIANAWLPDGRLAVTNTQKSIDVEVLDPDGNHPISPLFATPAAGEYAAAFSPDGRYVAYVSTETGREEVIVETFPPGRGKWQVSAAGGAAPVWAADGRKLYFAAGDAVMVADVEVRDVFRADVPRVLFMGPYDLVNPPSDRNYDLRADGRFVLVKRQVNPATPGQIVVLDGWTAADPSRGNAR